MKPLVCPSAFSAHHFSIHPCHRECLSNLRIYSDSVTEPFLQQQQPLADRNTCKPWVSSLFHPRAENQYGQRTSLGHCARSYDDFRMITCVLFLRSPSCVGRHAPSPGFQLSLATR